VREGTGPGDVLEVFVTVTGDARGLDDEVLGEEFAEALRVAVLIGMVVVEVELFEDLQIPGRLQGVTHLLSPFVCLWADADDRLPIGRFGRVEGGDGVVEGRDRADVRPQSPVADPSGDLGELGG